MDEKWSPISIEQVFEIIGNHHSFFLKLATQSEGGKGVFFFDTSNSDYKDAFLSIVTSVTNDLVIQNPLKQCKTLAEINPSSVNTIRILSLLRNNEVKIYSSILRMGINEAHVDNASSGGITCGICENGYLKNVAYSAKGKKYDVHPASKVIFSDIYVPGYAKAVELVKKLHPIIPDFRLVSWDIAIDEQEESVLIEVNLKYGELDFHQLNNGPLFGEDTSEILKEVFKKR